MAREYDGIFIVDSANENEGDVKAALSAIETELQRCGGAMVRHQDMGRKPFARTMKKRGEGIYLTARFSLEPDQVDEFSGRLKLSSSIFRSQILAGGELGMLDLQVQSSEAAEGAAEPETAAPAEVES